MALNSKYVPLSSLGSYFPDKSTGLPLVNGEVKFFSDINRSELKPVYKLSGSPPDYSYTELTDPLYLSAVGTFVDDSGNQIIIYGYPYDVDGNPENYFIQIYSTLEGVEGDLQASIEAWPGITPSDNPSNASNLFNFIPNGQFLVHNDIPEDILNDIPAGQIRQSVTQIAPGNWTFERPSGSTATDNVTFFEYGQYVSNPTASPRFAVQVQCLGADPSDAYKYLKVYFNDVNKFSSDTDQYTFAFTGQTFDSGNFSVGLYLIKFYGTGGSPSPIEITQLTTFAITSSPQIFQFVFSFGANSGKTVGDNQDDYVALAIGLPTSLSFGGKFTNFVLAPGSVTITAFPSTTNKDFIVRSNVDSVPRSNGFDLYLPQIQTPNGLIADQSYVGTIVSKINDYGFFTPGSSLSSISNEMMCDGNQYLSLGYSPLGIPFQRLWSRFWNTLLLQPAFGTGRNFISTYTQNGVGASPNLFVYENSSGSPTPPADGAIPTGITFFNIYDGDSSGYGLNAYLNGTTSLIARATTAGYVSPINPTIYNDNIPIDPGTSGFTMLLNRNPQTTESKMLFSMNIGSVAGLAGKYFRVQTLPGPTLRYFWFTVDGSGVDPAPGGTGVQINLKSSFSTADVASIIASVLAGKQYSLLVFPSSIPAGSYWTFRAANGDSYYVWYTVDDVGTDPNPGGILGIKVALLSTDTAQINTQKTMSAVNSTYYAAPDLRGMTLKGWDVDSNWDISSATRFGMAHGLYGTNFLSFFTYQQDMVIAHQHQIPWNHTGVSDGTVGAVYSPDSGATANETIPDYAAVGDAPNRYGSLYTKEYGFLKYYDGTTGVFGNGSSTDPQTSSPNLSVLWAIKY